MKPLNFKFVLLILVFIIIPVSFSFGQTIASSQQADSLFRSLVAAKPDTNKIRNILRLAYYQMTQIESSSVKIESRDGVLRLIRQAELLSDKLQSVKYQQKVQVCYARCDFLFGAFEDGRHKLMNVIQYYKRVKDTYQEASTWEEMGDNVDYDDSARSYIRLQAFEHAYQLFKKGHYRLKEIESYKNIADVHLTQGKFDLAEKELLGVLDQYRRMGYKTLQYTYDLLASVYRAKNDQKKELSYRLMMVQIMGNTPLLQDRSSLLLGVASLYMNLGKDDKALYWANKAIALYQQNDHDDFYYMAICDAAEACIKMRKYDKARALLTNAQHETGKGVVAVLGINMCFGQYYMSLHQYDKAKVYYLKALYSAQKASDHNYIKSWTSRITIGLADIYLRQRKIGEVRKYLAMTALLPKIKEHIYYLTYQLISSKADSAEGDFASALSHFKKYKQISDSLYNVTKSGQIAELEVQYETREKEQSIKLLNSEARSQKAKLDEVNLQRNIILAALVLFAAIGIISYRFYQYKQKSNESILKSHKLVESKNKQLELLVEEKEWLLKEVHHRVKNNLHTIICLLESQAAYLENDALEAMENSQNRIYTMSLIHQKLYQSDDIQTIDMASYIPELVQYLKDSFTTSSDLIYFNINIDRISLTQAIAIPVALIINEAITNSIKYAFPDNTGGEILISLLEEGESIKLALADNGVGVQNIEELDTVSLGLQLIKGLSKEIQGDFEIKSECGVNITIVFNKHPWDTYVYQGDDQSQI